jgi:hypothetical protein
MRRDGPFVQARCGRTMEGIVWLEPGIYEYKFVINGERWEEDPLNPHRVLNPSATFNSPHGQLT